MAMNFPKIKLKTRLKQFCCKHNTISKGEFVQGVNNRIGYNFVLYTCRDCDYRYATWEKEEDW